MECGGIIERMGLMLCQNCNKRTANVHFTKIINNKKIEMYLCEQCANEKGQFSFGSPLDVTNFLFGYANSGNDAAYNISAVKNTVCQKCGMGYEDFLKTGKMGCGECYNTYREKLKPALKRLHGSFKHSGKVPLRLSKEKDLSLQIERLKEMLDRAVQNEEYEKAAELRDKIRAMENK
jgi:protein arginine kinase activator